MLPTAITFFAVWGEDDIYGQLYSSTGTKIGSEFQINEIEYYQSCPRVAFNGLNYYVCWYGYESTFVGWDPVRYTFIINYNHYIYARIIDKNGNKLGSEIEVYNLYEPEGSSKEDLYLDIVASKDNLIIVYQFDFWYEIFASVMDGSGNIVAGSFQVNTVTAGTQLMSCTRSNSDTFFLAWTSNSQDGDDKGVFGKIYNRTGTVVANDFQVNSYTAGYQDNPVITANGKEYFVSWVSEQQDGDNDGVFARLFDNDGTTIGAEFMVNTTIAGYQNKPYLASNGANYVAAWKSVDDGIYCQVFDIMGDKDRGQIQIESYSAGTQGTPFIADNQFEYLILWTNGTDVSARIIHAGYGTDPSNADTDNDGLNDPYELFSSGTDPSNPDCDNDGISDGYEILYSGTNPFWYDTDYDGLSDYEELFCLTPQTIINGNPDYLNTNPDIAYNGSNHLAVWKSKSQSGLTYQVKGKIVNDFGSAYGDEFVIDIIEGMNELEVSYEIPEISYLDLNNPSYGNYMMHGCRFSAQNHFSVQEHRTET